MSYPAWKKHRPDAGLAVLERFGYPLDVLRPFLAHPQQHWHRVQRKKKDGTPRVCWSPSKRLRQAQRVTFLKCFELFPCPTTYATAFKKGASTVRNARAHRRHRSSLLVDMANAYESISARNIEVFLRRLGITRDDAVILSRLWTFQGKLRQGSPISQALFNIMLYRLDRKLAYETRCAETMLGITAAYSRYGDDLCISTSAEAFPYELRHAVFAVLKSNGVHWNGEKTTQGHHGVLLFPGVVVVNGDIRPQMAYLQRLEVAAASDDLFTALTARQRAGHRAYLQQFRPSATSPFLRRIV